MSHCGDVRDREAAGPSPSKFHSVFLSAVTLRPDRWSAERASQGSALAGAADVIGAGTARALFAAIHAA
jgi:hypothetical protein